MAWNPFRAAADAIGRAVGDIANTFAARPLYLSQSPSTGVHYEGQHDRVRPQWSAGVYGGVDHPNASDINQLYRSAPHQGGYAITVTGRTSGTYPGKEGVDVITLSFRLNRQDIRSALDNPRNRSTPAIMNQMTGYGMKGAQWIDVTQITIIDAE